ncbi:MAG TPA: Ldh family oxidoreductase [Aestuariivirga sp.]|nr:Ldh family oxidoreductase [Aestuariivirga sp.]
MRIASAALERFIRDLFVAVGVGIAPGEAAARHLVWCEMVGRKNFGIERVPILVKRIKAGVLVGDSEMKFEKLGQSIERLDAGGGFGFDAGERAMNRAMELASANGIGVVGVRNSNFFGAGAFYVNLAAQRGMIGLALSNSFPKVVAHGGLRPVLGTNPFAFGAPRKNGDHLLFDMATSALAGSTVRQHIAQGKTPPGDVNSEGALLPFGGAKGFGLALMVEMLAGVLTGAGVGNSVASMYNDFTRNGDNGHFMLAIDVARWISMDEYHARFEALITTIKASGEAVLLPGEVRWENYRESLSRGIAVDPEKWKAATNLSREASDELVTSRAG